MSKTTKKEKHTLHRSKREYAEAGRKCMAIGRIKQGHGSFVCPCCVHMRGRFSVIKTLSRRHVRRTYTITIEETV